jgi:hypothetical protein
MTKMNPHLFDILWEVNRDTGGKQPIQIISAYRSPETNEMLRSRSSGVAKHSQHTLGNAIDFRIPDVALAELRAAGLRLRARRRRLLSRLGLRPHGHFIDPPLAAHDARSARARLPRRQNRTYAERRRTDEELSARRRRIAAPRPVRRAHARPVTTASVAAVPEAKGLQRFISSIFKTNRVRSRCGRRRRRQTPQPQQRVSPARTQVASASPQAILPAVAREEQPKQRLQWQTGPAPVNAPLEPSEETTGATTTLLTPIRVSAISRSRRSPKAT